MSVLVLLAVPLAGALLLAALGSRGRSAIHLATAGLTLAAAAVVVAGVARTGVVLALGGVMRADALSALIVGLVWKDLRTGDEEILRDHPGLIRLGRQLADFSDTAAIASQLDLVVCSDPSVVHLAGSLGRPVWVLLEHLPDWRWLVKR